MWTAGVAGGAAAVAWWRVVGPGYVWMSGLVVAGLGAMVAVSGGGSPAVVGVVAAAVAIPLARRPRVVAALLSVAALGFVVAAEGSPVVAAVTGAVFLGGVTSEMLLGHWYLVDPRLPRWALQRLALAGGLGLLTEIGLVAGGVISGGLDADTVFAWAYVALAALTGLLVLAVWFSLREPRYTGVMAATGLSYLAVLTSLGVFVVGRMVAFG